MVQPHATWASVVSIVTDQISLAKPASACAIHGGIATGPAGGTYRLREHVHGGCSMSHAGL